MHPVTTRLPWIALVLVACFMLASHTFSPLTAQGEIAEPGWIQTDLYFGRNMPDDAVVADEQWHRFVQEVVTPLFPDGLTVTQGYGQFRTATGEAIRENASIITIIHPRATPTEGHFQTIRQRYRTDFQQQSVLLVQTPVHVSF